jgi:hypothetical protein
MFTSEMVCRVCGREFTLVAEMPPGALTRRHDGRLVGTCNMSAKLEPHTRSEVMRSVDRIPEVAAVRER